MAEPEFSDLNLMQEFSGLMDMVEDELVSRIAPEALPETRVFVGRENPHGF